MEYVLVEVAERVIDEVPTDSSLEHPICDGPYGTADLLHSLRLSDDEWTDAFDVAYGAISDVARDGVMARRRIAGIDFTFCRVERQD